MQCLSCGLRPNSQWLKKAEAIWLCGGEEPPDFDESLVERRRKNFLNLRVRHDEEMRSAYQDYLQSDQWREKRAKVMDRSRGVCESCGSARAEHVHHLTYLRVGVEPLFDLVAVCADCHSALHGGRNG